MLPKDRQRIYLTVTPDEIDYIDRNSKALNLSRSEYCRQAALNPDIVNYIPLQKAMSLHATLLYHAEGLEDRALRAQLREVAHAIWQHLK